MGIKFIILDSGFRLFFCILIILGYVVVHELVHGVIMNYYGCNGVEYGIDKVGFYATCKENYNSSEIELLAHSIHESISYTLAYLLAIFLGIKLMKGE